MNWKRLSGWMIAACCLAGQEIRAEIPAAAAAAAAPGISGTPNTPAAAVSSTSAASQSPSETVWAIGERDGRPEGFALAPDRFRDFIARDFGYEDKYYLIGHSAPANDFPYVLPGPADT